MCVANAAKVSAAGRNTSGERIIAATKLLPASNSIINAVAMARSDGRVVTPLGIGAAAPVGTRASSGACSAHPHLIISPPAIGTPARFRTSTFTALLMSEEIAQMKSSAVALLGHSFGWVCWLIISLKRGRASGLLLTGSYIGYSCAAASAAQSRERNVGPSGQACAFICTQRGSDPGTSPEAEADWRAIRSRAPRGRPAGARSSRCGRRSARSAARSTRAPSR